MFKENHDDDETSKLKKCQIKLKHHKSCDDESRTYLVGRHCYRP